MDTITLANPFYGAAGMDLNELVQISTAEAHNRAFLKDLTDAFARFSKPIIAAVVGFAVSCFPPPSSSSSCVWRLGWAVGRFGALRRLPPVPIAFFSSLQNLEKPG